MDPSQPKKAPSSKSAASAAAPSSPLASSSARTRDPSASTSAPSSLKPPRQASVHSSPLSSPRTKSSSAATSATENLDGVTRSNRSHRIGGSTPRRQSALVARRSSIRLDVSSFAAENYRPEYYLKSAMDEDTEQNVQANVQSLTAACEKSVAELKRAVFKNYGEFLQVAERVMEFESSLSELRIIQARLKSSANSLISSAGIATFISLDETKSAAVEKTQPLLSKSATARAEPKKPVIDHEARRVKMAAIAENVADFEKFITRDRFLVFEGGGISEQSSSSASPKAITLYLFNDAIAMASKKARIVLSSSSKKLNLERIWLLNEIVISDVVDSKSILNAFKIIRGGEYVLLQAETITGKRLWLQQIQKAQKAFLSPPEEPPKVASPRPESPIKQPAARTPTPTPTHSHSTSRAAAAHKKLDASQDTNDIPQEKFALMVNLLDRLNEETDKCNYDAAVELVDKIKYEVTQNDTHAPSLHLLSVRLNTQVTKLANFLYHEIADLIIGKEAMSKHIQRLVVLGYADEAREKFLAARSDFIKERTKHLRYVGDIAKTVNDIGFATFSSIASSADWYVSSFKDHTMTAGFVFWARLEIKNYVNMIVKQVFASEIDFRLIGDCVAIARRQCYSLRRSGLDFSFYLEDLLLPQINQVLTRYQLELEKELKSVIDQDDFMEENVKPVSKEAKISTLKRLKILKVCLEGVTASAASFYQMVLNMLNDVEPLMISETSEVVVARVASFFEDYSTGLLQASYSPSISYFAFMNIISNVNFLANDFLPSLSTQLEGRFNRSFGDLAKLYARLEATINNMYQIFAESNAKKMIPDDLSSYKNKGTIPEDANLSDWLVTMLPLLTKISRDAEPERRNALIQSMVTHIMTKLQRSAKTKIDFGSLGVQQFILDVHFLLLACVPFLSDVSMKIGLDACTAALNSFRQNHETEKLCSEDWYDERVRALLVSLPLDFGL